MYSLCLVTALLLVLSLPSFAAGLGFSPSPVYPENQISEKSYFDLQVEPGQSQDLTMRLTNTSDKDLVVVVEATNAFTASDGHMDYSVPGKQDETLPHPFADMVEIKEEYRNVTLAKGETKEVTVTMTTPQDAFEGKIIGGILLQQAPDEEDKTQADDEQAGASIQNVFQFAMPVVLQQNENPVEPEFKLMNVEPTLRNNQPNIQVRLLNNAGMVARGGSLTAEVFRAGETTPLHAMERNDFEMAPHSIWNLDFVSQDGGNMEAGDYNLKMTVNYEGETWEFDENFTIEKQQADDINKAAANPEGVPKKGPPIGAIVAIAAGVVVLALIIIIVLRVRKNNREYEALLASRGGKLPPLNGQQKDDPTHGANPGARLHE